MTENILEKHLKYKDFYKKNDLYWGLGIENELYLQFDKYLSFNTTKFLNNHKQERYSVNYFKSYKEDILKNVINKIPFNEELPLLVNSHSFSKTDKNNNSKTLYVKGNPPNPDFSGETLFELIHKSNDYIKENFDYKIVFDGDSIELITVNFYNTTLNQLIKEYDLTKKFFIKNIIEVFNTNNIYKEYGNINYMEKNHPFAVMLTNLNNMCMFNNGTLHFNITLPSKLDNNNKIEDKEKFIKEHQNYIKIIQLMEPFFLTVYGVPDPFFIYDNRLSACSQRSAVSRYIGIGTYNSDIMIPGKILLEDIDNLVVSREDFGWFKKYYDFCGYNKLQKIGYDINFNKHFNHGVEIRIFEHQNDVKKIKDICLFLIYLGDFSLEKIIEYNPILTEDWNNLIIDCMKFGKNTIVNTELYNELFSRKFKSENIVDLYDEIFGYLKEIFKFGGKFSKYCLRDEIEENNVDIEDDILNLENLLRNEIEILKNYNILKDVKDAKDKYKNDIICNKPLQNADFKRRVAVSSSLGVDSKDGFIQFANRRKKKESGCCIIL